MRRQRNYDVNNDINRINVFDNTLHGFVILNNKRYEALIRKSEDEFLIEMGDIIDVDANVINAFFESDSINLKLEIAILSRSNSVSTINKTFNIISKGRIYEMSSISFNKNTSYKSRSYYKISSNNFLYNTFKWRGINEITVNGNQMILSYSDEYLIIESKDTFFYEDYIEICYNIMLSIGFITGKFIQNKVFIFNDQKESNVDLFHYRKLRNSFNSIYHAVITNPFGYKNFISSDYAENLYNKNTLKPFDNRSLSLLTELIMNNSQIQYVMVLFNESNGNIVSLLIKNNCFYVVIEVLKKFFYEIYEKSLPKNYPQMGNISKLKAVFENLISINDEDIEVLKKRNSFLHGDVKDIDGDEMLEVMQKQITLIHKLVLSYIGYKGYIINHFHLRKNNEIKAFIKLN